jgi:pre-rRNA-processing protein TSR2
MDEFRAGVTACLRSWSALRTSVQNEWGGPTSVEKAESLRNEIISSLQNRSLSDIMDLEDALAIYMEEEFSIVLDDGSEKQVADAVWRMYEEAGVGRSTLAMQVIQMAEQVTKEFGHLPLQVQSSEPMDDDDDDDDDDPMDANCISAASMVAESTNIASNPTCTPSTIANITEYGSQPLFGLSREQKRLAIINKNAEQPVRQLGESLPEDPKEPQVLDDDGFAIVSTKRNASRKPI